MNIRALLAEAQESLRLAGVPDPAFDAGWMLAHVMGIKRLELLTRGAEVLPEGDLRAFGEMLARRLKREPLQYILGETVFMGHRLICRPPVLIPRNDTELLCRLGLTFLKPGMAALDLCCGSGAVALGLKLGSPRAHVSASDISSDALRLTQDNIALHGADISLHQGDLFAPLKGQRFHLICANPPYIPRDEIVNLQSELAYEPALALDGGEDGLAFYRRILREAPAHLEPGGLLLMEFGTGQAEALHSLFRLEFDILRVYDDMAGLPRVLAARKEDNALPG